MIDYKFGDRYNEAITQRRIAMPKFGRGSIGTFYVEAKPVGGLRKNSLIQRLVPYLAGDQPKNEITIEKLPNTFDELEFDAELFLIDPKDISSTIYNPAEYIRDAQTPYRGKIQSKVMLRTDGSYIYELQIIPKQQEGKEKIVGGSIQIAQIPIITLEFRVLQLLLLAIGFAIGGLVTYIFSCN